MAAGLAIALMLAAPAAAASAYGPAPTPASAPAATPANECTTPAAPDPNSREIIVCAVRPNGYRLDPDVLAAKRLKKKGESVAPRNPHETFADHSCATVGPMGCRGQVTVDMFTAAAALATMAQRISSGQEIGSMFQTTPAKGDYALYLEAKRAREQQEAEKAANAAQAKATAAQAAIDGPPPAPAR